VVGGGGCWWWGGGGGGGGWGGAVYVCTNPDLNGVVTLFNDVCV